MLKIFRYLKKAYIPIACIVLLLCVQVSCELTIPTYTSNIVNVGIQRAESRTQCRMPSGKSPCRHSWE